MGYQDENNNAGTLDIDDQSTFNNSGKLILDNSKTPFASVEAMLTPRYITPVK